MTNSQKIEALLFYKNEPVEIKWLANVLKLDDEKISEALAELRNSLEGRGVVLVNNGEEVSLGTHKDASDIIESIIKNEIDRQLSKAALETLSIVLYKGPISRSEIDYTRGVNSQFILRNLLIRGLVEKVQNESDLRSVHYKPSIALLSHLGIRNVDELPNYLSVREDLAKISENKNDTPV